MEKAYALCEKIINEVNEFSEKFITSFSKNVYNEDSLAALHTIVEDGFVLYRYLVDKKYYENKEKITLALCEVQKYLEKLQITKENAEKLKLSNALQIWDQVRLAIAVLACEVLDYRDSLN